MDIFAVQDNGQGLIVFQIVFISLFQKTKHFETSKKDRNYN